MPGFAASDLSKDTSYKLMTSAIVPRPIAWVSTLSEDGGRNLAPFSFFNGVAVMPPTLAFSVAYGDGERLEKDTYRNITATRECVVNIVTDETVEAMNRTSKPLAAEIDEFEFAGLTAIPSVFVSAPRVQESPIQFECTLNQIIRLENNLGRSDLIICNVVYIHVDDSVYLGDYKIDQETLHAVGRMGGIHYLRTQQLFQMTRQHDEVMNKKE
jgi:flavin reductase (DIM6/NTAB) family NADH-FMN oxidoreductase RutF